MIKSKKLISLLLVLSLSSVIPCQAFATTVSEAEAEIAQIEEQEAAAQQEAAQIEQEEAVAQEELNTLKEKLNALADEMEALEKDIDDKEDEIRQTEEDLVQAQITERQQYLNMKKRIRYMYENGNSQLIEIVFSSESMSEFLNNVEYVKSISQYDRDMLTEYQETVKKVQDKKVALEKEYDELKVMQDKLIAKQEEVEALYAEKAEEIKDLDKKLAETNERLAALAAAAQEAIRKKKEAEEAAAKAKAEAEARAKAQAQAQAQQQQQQAQQQQQQAQQQQQQTQTDTSENTSQGSATGTGAMTHPCPGGILTSPYGGRQNPTGYGYQFHKGIDLACAEGTPYYAADSGTVVIAGYSPSAGNWIVIDHGGGIQTYYMHSSAIYVSAGQTVSKGQNIGAVGTTGDSTGPHLHFQVVVNGVDTNPFNYL